MTEAAIIWWNNLPMTDRWAKTGGDIHKGEEHIVSIWIVEVVIKWWIYIENRKELSAMHIGQMANHLVLTNEEIATIYLKEQENKEVSNVRYPNLPHNQAAQRINEFMNGANWQKQQSEELIKELAYKLNIIKANFSVNVRYGTDCCINEMKAALDIIEPTITKANNYLNQSK